ncbi:UDP-N-acetylmuramoyl-L-alanyl-D-glutamate--2,6-diaminopimelate ligase [Aliiglaciecola sp. LCG003]|uniref:UDP-N-acetylmuramoyl-L-alanyl-D-glutamate--2, 6-diaminopimelate ligase n=1 Tax=Aliiglaciecola sp. LCG003 TaxID=3053655 RepID=UPI002572A33D|nr:UDP-N-acetylmuramoyl-L-alanyl-D-glutamate--2,6-diaminopimelate ligase [Aliiglaciecola sp. LCG003]WJG08733.1 UDP-N-acetylmuramoyl-L-alanyl-D-glutamate--2,6-diaminopimelate ligase [Aliiglaciecola sp. LCG003]
MNTLAVTPYNIKQVLADFQIDAPQVVVDNLVLDSREVGIHSVFVAVKGHSLDGRDFIPQAISLGARMIIQNTEIATEHGKVEMREQSILLSFFELNNKVSALAARFYGFPADQLDIIAVTGTNGKTSTVQLVSQLRALCGQGSASIGTLGAGMYSADISDLEKTLNTTPDACQVQRLMAKFKASQATQVAIEASSHALVQGRIQGLKTDIAVFTNLTRDHLDYHGTMQEYAQAKRLLLGQPGLRNVVLNMDDPEAFNWLERVSESQTVTVFSQQLSKAALPQNVQYCLASQVQFSHTGLRFELDSSWGQAVIECQLMGNFNVSNLLAGIACQLILGSPLDLLAQHCLQLKPVAGRMELFHCLTGGNIIVDFAHTPDALEQALKSARMHCSGKLVCVFGCGGDRDKGKRPLMGQIAEAFSDRVIITTDNSRSEAPSSIAADILAGIKNKQKVQLEADRKTAIQMALKDSQPGDLIVVAGKGHERIQIIGEQNLLYDERAYVETLSLGKQQ